MLDVAIGERARSTWRNGRTGDPRRHGRPARGGSRTRGYCYAPEDGEAVGVTDWVIAAALLVLIVVVLFLLKKAERRR